MSDDLESVLETLERRFTSGNSVPVTQARITKEEYEIIKSHINSYESQ